MFKKMEISESINRGLVVSSKSTTEGAYFKCAIITRKKIGYQGRVFAQVIIEK